jgi:flagellar basal body-associated protein FliL
MELFIPGLATLLIMGLIIFLIVPRLGAPILAVLSILILMYAVYNHIQLFSYEYKYSTWQDRLKEYASFIIVGVLILGILLYLGFLFATKGPEALPAANMQAPTNVAEVAEAANEAVVNVTKTVANTVTNTGFSYNLRNNNALYKSIFIRYSSNSFISDELSSEFIKLIISEKFQTFRMSFFDST